MDDKVIRVLSDEEVEQLGLNDYPYWDDFKGEDIIAMSKLNIDDYAKEKLMLPISSDEVNMKNKKCDYKLLTLLTLFSKHTPNENHRYIYKNDIIANKDIFEKMTKTKIETVFRNVRKLSKLEGNLVYAKNTNEGVAYVINYLNEDKRKYVLIEENILKHLISYGNSWVIKTYILLKYRCGNKEVKITRKDIASNIGLSVKSNKNLDMITEILKGLKRENLIKTRNKYVTVLNENGVEQLSRCTNIEITPYEEWIMEDMNIEKEI